LLRPVRMVVAVCRVTVTGKVDRDERQPESEGHRVPGVRVLRAAVDEDEIRSAGTPHQRAEASAGGVDLDPADVGRAGPGDTEFLGVLVEQRELVVRRGCDHGRSRPHTARSVQPVRPFLHLPSMRWPYVTSTAFRRLALVNVVLLAAIVVSGAIVRLTNSGLGCADWPNCSATKLVDVSGHHAAIEQVNRIFSGAIGVPLALALIGAYRLRPRRDDLIRLSWILFALFWGEAVLGGISVKVKLAWFSVTGHFLLAIALIAVALLMHHRAGTAPGPRHDAV